METLPTQIDLQGEQVKPRTIHEAVDALVNGERPIVFRDENGYNVRADVPSLIEQLEDAVSRAGNGNGGGKLGARPPVSIGVMTLLTDIADQSAADVRKRHGKHLGNIPDNLRRVASDRASLPTESPEVIEWIERITDWTDKARSVLGLEPRYPRGLRGIACPLCGAATVPGVDDIGQKVRFPTLQFEWSKAEDRNEDGSIPIRSVEAVECRTCGSKWEAGPQFYMLQALIDDMKRKNLTHETLAI